MIFSLCYVTLLAFAARFAAATVDLNALFRSSLSPEAEILLPGTNEWETQRQQRWTVFAAPNYIGVIKPATEQDIQETIKIAKSNNISFLATGGGHAFSDFSSFTGVSIDLGNFKSVKLDDSNFCLTVGGGVKYSDLFDLLYNAKRELPMGSCPCPGIIGATLGAGLGPYSGFRGLLIDALQSVRLVTADGEVVTASRTQHPELFWALRGAGSNFGIVTSATFETYNITNQGEAMTATLAFPGSKNGSFWKVLSEFDKNMPSKLALTNVAIYERNTSQALVGVSAIYFGPQPEGEALLKPFKDLGPVSEMVQMTPQNQLFPNILGACDPNQDINIYSLALTHTDPQAFQEAFDAMSDFWARFPGYQGRLLIQRFPNDAVLQVPSVETAYPWRDALIQVSIEGYTTDSSIDGTVTSFEKSVRAIFAKTSGYRGLATYTGYAHGDEGPAAWYSEERLPRLAAIKKKWDPEGMFSYNKPITH